MTKPSKSLFVLCFSVLLSLACTSTGHHDQEQGGPAPDVPESMTESKQHDAGTDQETTSQIYYLEIVTSSVDETIEALTKAHGLVFGDPIPEFGNAQAAELRGGGRIGVRGPLRETEEPVVRPYLLVDDIEASVRAAEEAGGQIALPPMEIPGQGQFAIYLLGGIQHGIWQN